MTQSDPTDNALAAIASILDNPETPQPPPLPREAAKPVAEKPEEKPLAPEQIEADGYCKVGPGRLPRSVSNGPRAAPRMANSTSTKRSARVQHR